MDEGRNQLVKGEGRYLYLRLGGGTVAERVPAETTLSKP
jgi:hypothetical protein